MFVLRVTYLAGRVYSAVFEDGDDKQEPEWPPHPSRLFSALVAAWGDCGGEEDLAAALRWLEQQDPPTIYAGDCTPRRATQVYVPVNDSVRLPEDRERKPRKFPSASLTDPEVYFVWKEAPPAELMPAFDHILNRTSSLGHSASLVAVDVVDLVPDGRSPAWVPHATKGERLRVAYPGRFEELRERHRKFAEDPGKLWRPSGGRSVIYGRVRAVEAPVASGVFGPMIVLRREEGPRGGLPSTLSVLSALRGALLAHAPKPVPEFLSGHGPGSGPEQPVPSERPHVALIPLPFVSAPHATGELLGAALVLPKGLSGQEGQIAWQVASSIEELHMSWGRWMVSVADAEEKRRALQPETWTEQHTVWSTVTPFVFDRYPKEPYGEEAEEIVRTAFTRVGLPEPYELGLHYNPWHLGVAKAAAFPAAPARPGKPRRFHLHVWARFEQPVAGPMIVGAGRYYGYGLFRALGGRRNTA